MPTFQCSQNLININVVHGVLQHLAAHAADYNLVYIQNKRIKSHLVHNVWITKAKSEVSVTSSAGIMLNVFADVH